MTDDTARYESRFLYVDIHYEKDDGSGKPVRTRWRRVRLDQVDEACRHPASNFNCFSTVQRFAARRHEQGEVAWMPLFFDLDAEDLEAARVAAVRLVAWFADAGLDGEQIRVWFSGNRGFHITVDPYALGARPSHDLHHVWRLWAGWLSELLGIGVIDTTVYSVRRMWRLPDSLHQKSGLHKVEISHAELQGNVETIRALARQPRGSLYDDLDIDALAERSAVDALAELHAGFLSDWQYHVDLRRLKPTKIEVRDAGEVPACVARLLERTTLPRVGTGHYAMLALASWCRDAGKSAGEAEVLLTPWAQGLTNISNPGRAREIAAEVRGVVRSVYEGDDVHFACAFIRALGAEDDRIACDHPHCKAVTEAGQKPAKPIACHLSEASRACYCGLPIEIEVVVSGKDTAPYLVPRRIAADCTPNPDKRARCGDCPLLPFKGHHEVEIRPDDPNLLKFVGANASIRYGLMKSLLRAPDRCRDVRISELKAYNVEDVRLVPALTEMEGGAGLHVVRRAFYVGHGLTANVAYKIIARTVPEPRTQYAVHLFHEAEPQSSGVEQFHVTRSMVEDMSVFQVRGKQSVWDKFDEIHTDLAVNVHRIWQRSIMAFAFDVCWHSVQQYEFHGQVHPRGWVEVFVLGDSGQGKTEMASRLRDWYGAGEWVTGEDAGRTGLTYSLQQNQNRWFLAWGVIPLNDGRLVLIDEFSGLPPEEFARMSGLRSSGILRVHRVISDRTWARTRLIYLSNPASGRALGTYAYGALALKELIPKAEDIRRLDLVVAVSSGEVAPDVVNQWEVPTLPNIYASDLCSQLVLWAWSRRTEHVQWTDDATKACLKRAVDMSGRYWADPPIVEGADQRLKIARIATAAAARTFSTHDGRTLIVKPAHVEFAVRLMDECYSSEGLRYDVLSEEAISRNLADPDRRLEVRVGFMQLPQWRELVSRLLRSDIFTRSDLKEQLDLTDPDATLVTKFLASHDLVKKISRGYVKEPGFISLLHELSKTVKAEDESFEFGANS